MIFKRNFLFFICLWAIHFSYIDAHAEFSFKGEIDIKEKQVRIEFYRRKNEALTLDIKQRSPESFFTVLNIKNLHTRFFDIATILENVIELKKDEYGGIQGIVGEVASKYTLVNHKPVQELYGHMQYRDNILEFNRLAVGNLIFEGNIKLKFPLEIDLRLKFSNVNVKDFVYFFTKNEDLECSGLVEGAMMFNGPWPHIQMTGNFESKNGVIGELAYQRMKFDFQGSYPILNIVDSHIIQDDGHIFHVLGNWDISYDKNYNKQFEALSMEPVVNQEGDNVEWTFKRIESEGKSGSTEIKYQIRKEDDVNTLSEENKDILGIERKVSF